MWYPRTIASTLNSFTITALSRVMWVWLAYTQYERGFVIVELRKFFVKSLLAANPQKSCPVKISPHTVISILSVQTD